MGNAPLLSEIEKPPQDFTFCPHIHFREFLFPVLLSIFVCIIGSIPYLYGKSLEDGNRVFMGMVGRGTPGSFGYIMFQRQAWEGKWWLTNQCTPETSSGSFFNLEWWILGRTARLINLSVIQFFHIERCLSVLFFLIGVYYLIAIVIDELNLRRFTLLLITFGSGFGWLIWGMNRYLHLSLPLSWDVEGIQIFSYLICKPHFIRAIALAVLMYAFLVRGFQTGKLKYFILSGAMALLHSLMRPYLIPESYIMFLLIPFLFCLIQKKWEWRWFYLSLIPAIIHFPAIIYYLWMSFMDPLGMSGWSQNHQFMGKPGFLIEYIAGIGWTWLICMAFFVYLVRKCKERISFLIVFTWIMVAWGICNLYPYWKPGQESGLYAFFIVPPISTMIGPYQWLSDFFSGHKKENVIFQYLSWVFLRKSLLALLVILFSIPSSVLIYYFMFHNLKHGHPQWAYFLSKDSYSTLDYLSKNGKEGDVVLASPKTSQFIFAFTPCRTVTGHFMLTKDYVKKTEDVYRFYGDAKNQISQEDILKKYHIKYVIWGPYEREISQEKPKILNSFSTIFGSGNTYLYTVP